MAQDSTDSLLLHTQQSAKITGNLTLQNQLLQQWISLTIGSNSGSLLNLLNSELETFNLAGSTFFYVGNSVFNSPQTDNIWALEPHSGSILNGVINPANLKYSGHYQGSGLFPSSIIASDIPVYTSSTTYQMRTNGISYSTSSLFNFSILKNGAASSNAGTASAAFDGNNSTSCTCGSTNPYVEYDLGSGNSSTPTSGFFILDAQVGGNISVQGSNDNSSWTTLTTITNANYPTGIYLSFSNNTAYRYFRVAILSTSYSFTVTEFMLFTSNQAPIYDTSNYVFGTSSLYLPGGGFPTGVQSSSGELNLSNYNWQMRGYFRFSSMLGSSNGNWMTLLTIENSLEIQATSTGLQVRYSQNGSSFTQVLSSSFTWTTNTWYYISVRRTSDVIYFYINGVAHGSISISGVSLESSASFNIGADSLSNNAYIGNMQEVEFFIGPGQDVDTAPGIERTTAFIPAVNWVSGAAYIASTLTAINVIVMIDQLTFASFGVPIVNTQWQFNVSCNNGVTWTNIPLTASGSLSTSTTMFLGSIVATKLTNTNQLKYQIISQSGKVLKCDGLILNWQ